MTQRSYVEYHNNNPFRVPAWRWERILEMVQTGSDQAGRSLRSDDEFIKRGKRFALRRDKVARRNDLYDEEPALYHAYEIHERESEDPEMAHIIQARLLARQTPEEIASTVSTMAEAVIWYEALFFNVRDRLEQRDWITTQVLLPAIMRHLELGRHSLTRASRPEDEESGDPSTITEPSLYKKPAPSYALPFLDGSLKMFAYFGGPHLVDHMIHGFRLGEMLNDPKGLGNWYNEHYSHNLKRRSVMAAGQFDVTRWNVMELFAAHARIVEIERSEDAATMSRTTMESHVLGFVNAIPWAAGKLKPQESQANSRLNRFRNAAVELRDDELLRESAGEEVVDVDAMEAQRFPPPRLKAPSATASPN